MRLYAMAELQEHMKMCHLMNVSNEKSIRIKIVVECDAWMRRPIAAGEVADLGLTAFGDFKIERLLFPELKAIIHRFCGKMLTECFSNQFFLHSRIIAN